jgi:hypothetical protein
MRVVGTVVFPLDTGTGGLGVGAVITVDGAIDLACGPSGPQSACGRRLARFASYVAPSTPPTNLVNFGEAVNFPSSSELLLPCSGRPRCCT